MILITFLGGEATTIAIGFSRMSPMRCTKKKLIYLICYTKFHSSNFFYIFKIGSNNFAKISQLFCDKVLFFFSPTFQKKIHFPKINGLLVGVLFFIIKHKK
jgi:hypothetical protein